VRFVDFWIFPAKVAAFLAQPELHDRLHAASLPRHSAPGCFASRLRDGARRGVVHKSEGAISLSRSRPLLTDFSKIWFGVQITTDCHSRIVRSLRAELALPVHFRHSIRCKSFLGPSISSQFPGCFASPVAGSLRNSVPGSLAGPIPGLSDVPCLLSPTGRFLLR
jgi:hypothetical protein